jgi:hypothetical protein
MLSEGMRSSLRMILTARSLTDDVQNHMNDNISQLIRESYDRIADEYARRIYNELQHKPFDRDLLDRFAAEAAGRGRYVTWAADPVMLRAICAMPPQRFSV